jgi:hypothetical protein
MNTNTQPADNGQPDDMTPEQKRRLHGQIHAVLTVAASQLLTGTSVAGVRDDFVRQGMPVEEANSVVASLVEGLEKEWGSLVSNNLFGAGIAGLAAAIAIILPLLGATGPQCALLAVLAIGVGGLMGFVLYWNWASVGWPVSRLRAELDRLRASGDGARKAG